ncbi:YTH-domain-containing protein [Lepidopterella palustris CBS 459.81]|uniref:YTH-domain-containing protein n=1 Tax=Lepidopterella palustris CBS 459.81 TaxID=1314670 RepID=A0A8E2JJP1_9PEZI|nr:YTH-domain-containing protein [Lepidopterella palustris CBS 459.81]
MTQLACNCSNNSSDITHLVKLKVKAQINSRCLQLDMMVQSVPYFPASFSPPNTTSKHIQLQILQSSFCTKAQLILLHLGTSAKLCETQMDTSEQPQPNTIPGIQVTQPHPSSDPQYNAARAAELRAKLMSMRSASRTPGQDITEQKTTGATQNVKRAAPERKASITDVDGLLAEGRAAAEAKAKQNNSVKASFRTDVAAQDRSQQSNQQNPPTAQPNGKSKPAVTLETQKRSDCAQNNSNGSKDEPNSSNNVQGGQNEKKNTSPPQARDPGEIREPHVDSSTRPHSRNSGEESRLIRPKHNGNRELPKYNNRSQLDPKDKYADATRDCLQSTGIQPRQSEIRLETETSSSEHTNPVTSTPILGTKNNGERQNTATTSIGTNNDRPASTKILKRNKTVEECERRTDRQSENTDNRAIDPRRESVSQQDSALQAQRSASEGRPKNAATYSHYFDDLDEWLEITGYHDQQYRKNQLRRQRALAELELQREQIEREALLEHEDKAYLTRPQSFRSTSARPNSLVRASSVAAMPPPPLPALTSASKTPEDISLSKINNSYPFTPMSQSGSKRPRSPTAGSAHNRERVDKLMRLDTAADAQQRGGEYEERVPRSAGHEDLPLSASSIRHNDDDYRIRGAEDDAEPRHLQARPQSSRGRAARSPSPLSLSRRISMPDDHVRRIDDDHTLSRGPIDYHRGRPRESSSPSHRTYVRARSPVSSQWSDRYAGRRSSPDMYDDIPNYHPADRGRGRGRGRVSFSSRGGKTRPYSREGVEYSGAASLNLRAGGVRYFMIKSWNYDNVEAAQREGVWATQPHNEELFKEAFKSCRHVILVFSVNKSTAFQGYARMQSAPGTAPTPSWTKNLLWQSSGAFFIRWITIAETRFSRVGHLKNSLNEGQAVLVGRDGQEIEEECGRMLCECVDEVGERFP